MSHAELKRVVQDEPGEIRQIASGCDDFPFSLSFVSLEARQPRLSTDRDPIVTHLPLSSL